MVILAILMILGSIPFTIHYTFLSGKVKNAFENIEVQTLIKIIASAFVVISVFELLNRTFSVSSVASNMFNLIAVITTTGSSMQDVGYWAMMTDSAKMIVIVLMFIGGCAGSTAGGLKIIRAVTLSKGIMRTVRKSELPKTAIVPLKVGKHVIEDDELIITTIFFCIYVTIIILGAFIILTFGIGLDGGQVHLADALFVSTSAMATASPTTLFIDLQPVVVKLALIAQMIAGRLEILPLMALLGYTIDNIKRFFQNSKTR